MPLAALIALGAPCALAADASVETGLELSFDQAYPSSRGLVADEELAVAGATGGFTRVDLGLPVDVDLAAFHRLSATSFLFSVDVPTLLPDGLYVEPSDAVSYSFEFGYELAFGLDGTGAGIDALSYDPVTTTLHLSFDTEIAFVGDSLLHAHDVMSVSFVPELAFGILFSGCDAGVPIGVDVDAIHWDPEGSRLFLSLDTSTAAGAPLAADDEDVVSWSETEGWAMVADLSARDGELASLDADALSVRFASDPWLFSDSFESGDTGAWSSAVP